MARMSKEEIARREGIAYACRLAKEKGLDALEKDMRDRGVTDCPVGLDSKDMEKFVENVKNNVMDTFLIMTACTLQDEFGFGEKRISRFIGRFHSKAECIAEGYATWADMQEQLKDELKIELEIRKNEKDVLIRKKTRKRNRPST